MDDRKERGRLGMRRAVELRQEIAVGVGQARRGDVVRSHTDEELRQFFDDVKSRGRRARARKDMKPSLVFS